MTWCPYRFHQELYVSSTQENDYRVNHKTHQVKKKGEGGVYHYPRDKGWLGFWDPQSGADYVTRDICTNGYWDIRNAGIIWKASNESYLPAPPPPEWPHVTVNGNYAVEVELQQWMLQAGGACLEMCWAWRRKNCKWGRECKYLHYVDGGAINI